MSGLPAMTNCQQQPTSPQRGLQLAEVNSSVAQAIALGEEYGRDVRPWGGDTVLLDGVSPMSAHAAARRIEHEAQSH